MAIDRAQSCGCCSESPGPPGPPGGICPKQLDFGEPTEQKGTGAEIVVRQWVTDFATLDAAIVLISTRFCCRTGKASGTVATYRVRLGGTQDNPDGTVLALVVQPPGPTLLQSGLGAGFARPADGATLVKLTIESGDVVPATIDGTTIVMHDAGCGAAPPPPPG